MVKYLKQPLRTVTKKQGSKYIFRVVPVLGAYRGRGPTTHNNGPFWSVFRSFLRLVNKVYRLKVTARYNVNMPVLGVFIRGFKVSDKLAV